jgi:hypothetical protein
MPKLSIGHERRASIALGSNRIARRRFSLGPKDNGSALTNNFILIFSTLLVGLGRHREIARQRRHYRMPGHA